LAQRKLRRLPPRRFNCLRIGSLAHQPRQLMNLRCKNLAAPMSQLGHKRTLRQFATFSRHRKMSVYESYQTSIHDRHAPSTFINSAQNREDWGEFSWLESVSNDGWRLFWQLSENRLHYARITTTGILQWVSTFTVSLPSTIAEMPRRPWDAIKIASHPVFLAVSIMAS
jgi:hypothetical protein